MLPVQEVSDLISTIAVFFDRDNVFGVIYVASLKLNLKLIF
jgi:hypothetical protein